jgi:hypothetical protein
MSAIETWFQKKKFYVKILCSNCPVLRYHNRSTFIIVLQGKEAQRLPVTDLWIFPFFLISYIPAGVGVYLCVLPHLLITNIQYRRLVESLERNSPVSRNHKTKAEPCTVHIRRNANHLSADLHTVNVMIKMQGWLAFRASGTVLHVIQHRTFFTLFPYACNNYDVMRCGRSNCAQGQYVYARRFSSSRVWRHKGQNKHRRNTDVRLSVCPLWHQCPSRIIAHGGSVHRSSPLFLYAFMACTGNTLLSPHWQVACKKILDKWHFKL